MSWGRGFCVQRPVGCRGTGVECGDRGAEFECSGRGAVVGEQL